ncbi:hypothetical protein [Alteromonas sp. a30]|uniref:hypothetical protein n=1 Tax=Alteromonas sp. a30 TaxID=2730917 RepID=UPI002281847D|nr:hypothetical protein [Alteromonas sp. a30]MCY7296271.1 hypothetical protein [Alteromonas sp. a30]
MLSLFKTKPLLDDGSAEILINLFVWCAEHFDHTYFLASTRVVEPTGEFFPEKVSSIEEMSQTLFSRVKEYAGLSQWPINLAQPNQLPWQQQFPFFQFEDALRGENAQLMVQPPHPVFLSYNPNQINQPQDLVSSMANGLALVMLHHVAKKPSEDADLALLADALSIYLGFGVMITNTAYHFRGSCASCYNPYANRQAALAEDECVFLHALVCYFKPEVDGAKHLKPHLKAMFKRAKKQIEDILVDSANPLLLAMAANA